MRAARSVRIAVLFASCAYALACQAAPNNGAAHPARRDLIGAWRLVSIDCSGPHGPIVDPFYQADSIGTIIYDASGWMSVQIAAPHREVVEVPEARLSASAAAQDARSKVAAFDSYYAYFGTWDFDPASSVVTHHVKASLISSETGLEYTQNVSLVGGRLIFTTRSGTEGEQIIRRKIWQRIAGFAN